VFLRVAQLTHICATRRSQCFAVFLKEGVSYIPACRLWVTFRRALPLSLNKMAGFVFNPARKLPLCSSRTHLCAASCETVDALSGPNLAPAKFGGGTLLSRRGRARNRVHRVSTACADASCDEGQPDEPRSAAALEELPLHNAVRSFIENSLSQRRLAGHERELAARLLPTREVLKRAGRSDLIQRIRAAGGSRFVAKEMGLALSGYATVSYKNNLPALQREIREFNEQRGCEDIFPTADAMRSAGRLDIIAGVKAHGGSVRLASAMELKLQRGRRPASREERMEWLRKQFAPRGVIPTNQELIANGRIDVLRHIVACGGREEVSKILALPVPDRTVFSEDLFSHDVCTSSGALEYNSLEALSREEVRGGGGGAILDADGGRRRRHHLYRDFGMLKDELLCFIYDWGHIGVMPTAQQLIRAKRRDLVRAMSLHGGQKVVAYRLGLVRQSLSRTQVLECARVLSLRTSIVRNSCPPAKIGSRAQWGFRR
jgi:hypothetical protein